jgi:tetratricopeptide (TPR) repeat protein
MEVLMRFKRRPITSIFFLAVFFWYASAENANAQLISDFQASIHVDHAFEHLAAGNYERVIELIDAAFNLSMANRYLRADAYYARSYANMQLENFGEAYNDILRSMELHYWANSFDLLSGIYYRTGRHKEALLAVNRAIEIDDQYLGFFRGRAVVYTALRKFENALNDINHVLNIEPQSASALSIKSSIYIFMGEFQKALAYTNKAISIEPDNRTFWARRGVIYLDMGNLDEALIAYSRAIDLNDRRHQVFVTRANIFRRMGNNLAALNDFNMAIQLAPNVLQLYYYRGRVHLEMGNFQATLSDFAEIARLSGDEELQRQAQIFQGEMMPVIEMYTHLRQFAELLERFSNSEAP